ncbi:exonuclease SbcCD subunit D [Ruminococcus sp.]|uniref:exonuclease SbcCD subunit D n=1 Tax=Ruminococcus sp. TaxID=41978 RepID=UPI0025FC87CB|nr:exonuclease SbcCD subunit D [Ruminococcus sp.]MBQ8966424.1 exonuclease SbcCD subunit D [Ruminococcus sp.]
MKFAHISDLHLGKRLDNYSLIEDQRHILSQIIKIALDEGCDGILIAGDIYDKASPSAEAVKLFDEFLTELSRTSLSVYIISGNHDSAERINYGREIMEKADIHIAAEYDGKLSVVTVEDEYGSLDICMLPFLKPSMVRHYHEDHEIASYTDMIRAVIESSGIDKSRRCLMMCHQFISGAATCDSEYLNVGTLDNVDANVFEGFDYVALGHIHGPQEPAKNVRYCGTPLKYSGSEIKHKKSVTIVELKGKNDVSVSTVPLVPLRDMHEIKGKYDEIMDKSFYEGKDLDDFYYITLTDNDEILNVMQRLRTVYKNIVKLTFDNERTRTTSQVKRVENTASRSPFELFAGLYKEQNGVDLDEEQAEYIQSMISRIWGDGR